MNAISTTSYGIGAEPATQACFSDREATGPVPEAVSSGRPQPPVRSPSPALSDEGSSGSSSSGSDGDRHTPVSSNSRKQACGRPKLSLVGMPELGSLGSCVLG